MIKPVSYATILDDPNWPNLFSEYAAECKIRELGAPCPQRDLYEILEHSGGFQAFGVYEKDLLVGFATVLIYVLPHYGRKIATTESIFVLKGKPDQDLIQHLRRHARNHKCGEFLYVAPVGSRFDRLLSACEMHHSNNVYIECL
jgi:hypothetical protein